MVITSGQRILRKGRIALDFCGRKLNVTIEYVSSGQRSPVAYTCTRCRTCTHCCLLAGTAEGSVVFTRWRQCAHPSNTLLLEAAWDSLVNNISNRLAVLVGLLPTYWSRWRITQWYLPSGINVHRAPISNNGSLGPQECDPQTAPLWIQLPLGTEVGLGPDQMFRWGPSSPPQKKKIGPCLLWPNGWMDQDATCYGGRHRPGDIVLDEDPAPP